MTELVNPPILSNYNQGTKKFQVRGMTLEEAGRIRNTEIAKELCLPPVKCMYALLCCDGDDGCGYVILA